MFLLPISKLLLYKLFTMVQVYIIHAFFVEAETKTIEKINNKI